MHTLQFDRNGLLTPYELIEIARETFEHYFLFNEGRLKIYTEFRGLVSRLDLESIVEIWIDGSFVTMKPNPRDMDLVVFVKSADYDRLAMLFAEIRQNVEVLDVYFVRTYPLEHPKYFLTNFDKLDWQSFFGRNRQNVKKGIIKLLMS
ncbi:DUF6932 family protein [Dyadobacter sp.]|uniref:DUF6932 family protein n=1 Tax=Dyadobacter sp. TaxID=1914288 RepID=UPI003F718400